MARRLLITDHYDTTAFADVERSSEQGAGWDILLLGGSPDWFRWRYQDRLSRIGQARVLDAEPFSGKAHADVNGFVLELGASLPHASLGGSTLAQLLRDEDGTEWWFLECAEKGPYRGPFIGLLYRVAIARGVLDAGRYHEVSASLRDKALARVVAPYARSNGWHWCAAAPPATRRWIDSPVVRLRLQMFRAAGRAASAWILARSLGPLPKTRFSGRWVFTVFPSWWGRATSDRPADRFFTNVEEAGVEGYFAWLTNSRVLWRHRAVVRESLRRLRAVPLQRFLSWRDVLSTLSPAALGRLKQFRRRMQHHVEARFLGFDVAPLVVDEVTRSLTGFEAMQDRLLRRAVARAAEAFRPAVVLYRAEFQPIESALLRGLQGRAAAVGFHHHPFGVNYLSMRFTSAEMAKHLEASQPESRPLPDGIVAIGPLLARHVAEGGLPAARIAVCGPQRYGPLTMYRRRQQPRGALRVALGLPPADFVVFVALAIVEADTEALFGAMVGACRDVEGVRLIVRTHPNRPAGDPALHATLQALGPDRATLMPADGAMYDYIAASDCMVCVGSMIAFEAMALGIVPIVFDNPATFGAVSLAEYASGLFVVKNAAELGAAIEDVRRDSSRARMKRHAWPSLLADVMGDLEAPLGPQLQRALDRFTPAGAKAQ